MNFNVNVGTYLGQVKKCLRVIRKPRKTQSEAQIAFLLLVCLYVF